MQDLRVVLLLWSCMAVPIGLLFSKLCVCGSGGQSQGNLYMSLCLQGENHDEREYKIPNPAQPCESVCLCLSKRPVNKRVKFQGKKYGAEAAVSPHPATNSGYKLARISLIKKLFVMGYPALRHGVECA